MRVIAFILLTVTLIKIIHVAFRLAITVKMLTMSLHVGYRLLRSQLFATNYIL